MNHTRTNLTAKIDDCGCGGGWKWILLLIAGAVFLALLAGLLFAAAIALLWFLLSNHTMAPGAAPSSPLPLPDLFSVGQFGIGALIALVALLLLAILVLLIILMFCSCGKPAWLKDLLALIPMLKGVRQALLDTADALALMETGLRAAKIPVEAAGTLLHDAGDHINVNIKTLEPDLRDAPVLGFKVMVGLKEHDWHPLSDVQTKLYDTSKKLKDADGLSSKLEEVASKCHDASEGIRKVANVIPA